MGWLQILAWGGSFFLMAVMADPIMKETGWPSPWVFGAVSLGILVSAVLAPLTSRLISRWGGRIVLASSGLFMAIGLFIMASSTSLPLFLCAWAVIGVGMALGLYDSLLATSGGLYGERAGSAITGITLISGFATTLVWPVVALAIEHFGWRSTCLAYGCLLLVTVAPLYLWVLPGGLGVLAKSNAPYEKAVSVDGRVYLLLTTIFAVGAVIMTVMSVHLIALLQGQGYSLAIAVGLSALVGPSQVGSRFLQVFARKHHPIGITLISAVLIAAGLMLVALAPAASAVGLVIFGAGNGLRAIIRGVLPLALMSPWHYVLLMGRMARPSLIVQALTPLVGGYIMQTSGVASVWVGVCSLAVLNVVLVCGLMRLIRVGGALSPADS